MAFQVSPGVQVKEVDLTNIVPAVASTAGGYAGQFRWGPVDEVVTVSNTKDLIDVFGEPSATDAAAENFYSAEAFLKYGSALRVVRISTTQLASANVAGAASQLIKNESDYEENFKDGSLAATLGAWTSRYPGVIGNSVGVQVCGGGDAYSKTSTATTAAATYEKGATAVTLLDSSSIVVGDVVKFANHDTKYRVLDNSTDILTIEQIGAPAGTGLSVALPVSQAVDRFWEYYDLFDAKPNKSASATRAGASADEVHVVVYDVDGKITGTKGQALETYGFVSLASDARDLSGNSLYYKNVVARDSDWVWWTGHETALTGTASADTTHSDSVGSPFLQPALPITQTMTEGSDGRSPTAGQKYGAWDDHFTSESVDISFLIVGTTRCDDGSGTDQDTSDDWTTIVNEGIRICENRKDCLLVASPKKSDVVNVTPESSQTLNVVGTVNSATSSSYAVFDSTWVYSYDRYNDKYCWVPANGHSAGLMARTDLLRDPWFSPAGLNRGQYLGITKLAFNPSQISRDDLYRARVNPVVTFPGQGTVLYGDKTGLTVPSAFDRINVRRLFIVLEKAIATAAKAQLFEFNDAFTRAQFRSAVEPFLRDVKNRRGLIDFAVVCDETNNTDSVIDRNEFVCSIFVKPARSINFITLNFVAARTGVEFEEIYSAV